MPRAKGGAVQGTPGKQYAQRSDLRSAEPVSLAPSQQYGERASQQAAQRVIPIATPPAGAPVAPSPAGGPSAPPPVPQGQPQPTNRYPATPPGGPGVLPFLHPSNRPNEPLTAGMATGPGPGPEVLTGVGAIVANQQAEQGTLKNLLGSLAAAPASSAAIRDLAAVAGSSTP